MIQNGIPREYLEIFLVVPLTIHDAVCSFIIDNYSTGIILSEEEASPNIGIKFYFNADNPPEENIADRLAKYINEINQADNRSIKFMPESIRIKRIENTMWEEKYRKSIKPIIIENIVVRPPWVELPSEDKIDIIVEPKMAFGTGSHETTSLCLREILHHVKPNDTLFDLGCGSGILSILAAKLGAVNIKGADIDIVAVDNARENIVINNVEDKIEIVQGSVEMANDDQPYDIVVANIIKSTILELFPQIFKTAKDHGMIILSGLLIEDKQSIVDMLAQHHLNDYKINQDGEWLAFTVRKQ